MSRRITLTLIAVFLFVAGGLPVLFMVLKSLMADGHPSFAAYHDLFTSRRPWILMANSLTLAAAVTALATLVGVPLGLLLGKTNLPFRKGFTFLFVTPLLFPPYFLAVSWSDLVTPGGLLSPLIPPSILNNLTHLLFGFWGCAGILFAITLPVPFLLTLISLRTLDPRLEEAGRLVTTWRGVIRRITLPLIRPAIFLSALLVFLLTFGEFTVPNFLRYPVFPVESFTQFSAFYNFRAATASAIPLVAVTLLLLFFEASFLRKDTYLLRPSRGMEETVPVNLGRHRGWLFGLILLLIGGVVLVPLLALVVQSGGLDVYREALVKAGASLWHSLSYAVSGATLLAALGFFTGYLIQTRALRIWRAVDTLTLFLFTLPATVVGIGLAGLWNRPWTNFIYGTPLIILLGYLAKYTALTSRISVTQFALIPPSMEESARVAGVGWGRRMIFIMAPLASRGILIGWVVGYIFTLRDTGITMLVYPPGHETLPVRIYTLMANGSPRLIAALCVVMIVLTLLPLTLVRAVSGLYFRRSSP